MADPMGEGKLQQEKLSWPCQGVSLDYEQPKRSRENPAEIFLS